MVRRWTLSLMPFIVECLKCMSLMVMFNIVLAALAIHVRPIPLQKNFL